MFETCDKRTWFTISQYETHELGTFLMLTTGNNGLGFRSHNLRHMNLVFEAHNGNKRLGFRSHNLRHMNLVFDAHNGK
ncbi:hypothetical protein CEXT_305071 [Caerostris extrusa]|uniref:Uncharacterized protein n=1 Tax=Caerostris extrusa TaxID=172846 RepID=A0AAV4NY24_CAEEX|nr:hypothetical protein CEXT_305071 [Caerostris extrusa]